MQGLRHFRAALAGALLFGGAGSALAEANRPDLSVELNTTRSLDGACQLLMVVDNRSKIPFSKLTADLVLFDQDGVIVSRVSTPFGSLRPEKRQVLAFPIEDVDCATLSRVLLNQVTECEYAAEADFDCTDAIRVRHRGTVVFEK
jgi:hypothetical protein